MLAAELGTVGTISSISFVKDVNAVSCKNEHGPLSCHGYTSTGKGDSNSDFQCRHLPQ